MVFFYISRSDVKSVAHVLTHCTNDDVNAPVSPRDDRCPLHVASSLGNLAIVQLLIWVRVTLLLAKTFHGILA